MTPYRYGYLLQEPSECCCVQEKGYSSKYSSSCSARYSSRSSSGNAAICAQPVTQPGTQLATNSEVSEPDASADASTNVSTQRTITRCLISSKSVTSQANAKVIPSKPGSHQIQAALGTTITRKAPWEIKLSEYINT